eukprot:3150213-Lingulodinium_polyedra.AAC.1
MRHACRPARSHRTAHSRCREACRGPGARLVASPGAPHLRRPRTQSTRKPPSVPCRRCARSFRT